MFIARRCCALWDPRELATEVATFDPDGCSRNIVDLVCKQPFLALCLCPCFAGLRPRAPNTAVLTLRHGCGDIDIYCSPKAALYGIPASSQLKLRPSTPMDVQETKWIWFASNLSLPFIVSLLRRSAPSRYEYRRAHLKARLRGYLCSLLADAALYGIPASSQLKLRPSTPMGVQET